LVIPGSSGTVPLNCLCWRKAQLR